MVVLELLRRNRGSPEYVLNALMGMQSRNTAHLTRHTSHARVQAPGSGDVGPNLKSFAESMRADTSYDGPCMLHVRLCMCVCVYVCIYSSCADLCSQTTISAT